MLPMVRLAPSLLYLLLPSDQLVLLLLVFLAHLQNPAPPMLPLPQSPQSLLLQSGQ